MTGTVPFAMDISAEDIPGDEILKYVHMVGTHQVKFLADIWREVPPEARHAVSQMLKLNPRLRSTAATLLRHPWLKIKREPVGSNKLQELYKNAFKNLLEGQFKKLVMRVMVEQLPHNHSHVRHATMTFLMLDLDRDGLLSCEEFLNGLKRVSSLGGKLEDPAALFDAADRNGSGYINAQEFVAATLPPKLARSHALLYQTFRAFDRRDDGAITIDEVMEVANMLEGCLLAPEQTDELRRALQRELDILGVAHTAEEGVEGREHREGQWALVAWLQHRAERYCKQLALKHRQIDFGEFVYLCNTQGKGKVGAKAFGNVCRKEVYRLVENLSSLDLYNIHNVDDILWPPEEKGAAMTPRSPHRLHGGLDRARKERRGGSKERKGTKDRKGLTKDAEKSSKEGAGG